LLPILIVPDRWGELADALPSGDVRDSAPRYWVATREAQVRIYCRLSREIEIRHKLPAIPRPNMAAPASLQDCELLLKLLMRRKADAMGRRDRADIGRALHATRPITDSMMTLSPSVATWLLWAMSWRGVSTARQIASPPLHAPTLLLKWWTSIARVPVFWPRREPAACSRRLCRTCVPLLAMCRAANAHLWMVFARSAPGFHQIQSHCGR
jgi:hypothetical protein